MRHRPLLLVVSLIAALLAPGAAAQGLPATTDAVPPVAQTAASADAASLLVNPAGLGFVQGIELSLGGLTRVGIDTGLTSTTTDALLAVSPWEGFAFGAGTGLMMPDGGVPRWWNAASIAFAADRALSTGFKLTGVTPLVGGGSTQLLADVGMQLRPMRMVAFGAVIEGVGSGDLGPATGRFGVSVRPAGEIVTIGIDARIIPGDKSPVAGAYFTSARIVPAASARVSLGGLAFGLGVSVDSLGLAVATPPSLAVLGSVEVNGEHLGGTATAGADGVLGSALRAVAGVRVRASSVAWQSIIPGGNRFLAFSLTGDGATVEQDDGFLAALFDERPSAAAVLAALDNAAEDPEVEGVLVRLRGLSLGWARAAELRASLLKLKAAGKKVVVHMDGGDDVDVYVASAADKVFLTPAGGLDLNGLRAEMVYLADTLAKIGVEAQDVHAGNYKSAPRTFTATEPSPEELEVEAAILDSAFATLVDGIAAGRGLSADDVKATIDLGGLPANRALEKKIVDALAYDDELEKKLEELVGHPVKLDERYLDDETRNERWDAPPVLAVIPVVGAITMGSSGGGFGGLFGGNTGADDVVRALNDAAGDDEVKAIVLRIDSPGGDALASDLIWRAVMKAKEKKPVIASMGDVAASGGYYVASAAHVILAEPDTITGSIGVFGLMFNGEELLDKIGVRTFETSRGALPGPSAFRPLTDEERAALQGQVDSTYERFLDAVIEGRGTTAELSRDALRESAEGRVWTGTQAKERKLVDQMGGFLDAIRLARQRAQMTDDEDIRVTIFTGRDDDLPRMVGLASVLSRDEREGLARATRLLLGDPATVALLLEQEHRPLATLPYRLTVR